jgi:hypothetical protein
MENPISFVKEHPVESALLAGVSLIVLYVVFAGGSSSNDGGQAALQNAYFNAESIQAQSGAEIQVANINAGRDTALATIASNASTTNNTTWAAADQAINASNNQAAIAALPYAEESNLISALAGLSSQTQTTQSNKSSSGFFGIGASNKTTVKTSPTPAAESAAQYLETIVNGLFSFNGGG